MQSCEDLMYGMAPTNETVGGEQGQINSHGQSYSNAPLSTLVHQNTRTPGGRDATRRHGSSFKCQERSQTLQMTSQGYVKVSLTFQGYRGSLLGNGISSIAGELDMGDDFEYFTEKTEHVSTQSLKICNFSRKSPSRQTQLVTDM